MSTISLAKKKEKDSFVCKSLTIGQNLQSACVKRSLLSESNALENACLTKKLAAIHLNV